MEESTIIKSLTITRFGILNDDNGTRGAFRVMKTYGIYTFEDRVANNDVERHGSLRPPLLWSLKLFECTALCRWWRRPKRADYNHNSQ
jgi:hypothetical protein